MIEYAFNQPASPPNEIRDADPNNQTNFFVRNGPVMLDFFMRVWQTREFVTASPILESQETIWNALRDDPPPFVKLAPQRAFNSYYRAREGNWEPGDFLIHFAGMGGERSGLRLELMREYAERVDWSK